jgi:uncharacterized membrane protein
MSYNLTNITTASGNMSVLDFTVGVNRELMHNFYGVMILVGLWAVIFISVMSSSNDGVKAGLTSSFIIFALAVSLAAIGLVPPLAVFIPLIVTAIIVALSWGK